MSLVISIIRIRKQIHFVCNFPSWKLFHTSQVYDLAGFFKGNIFCGALLIRRIKEFIPQLSCWILHYNSVPIDSISVSISVERKKYGSIKKQFVFPFSTISKYLVSWLCFYSFSLKFESGRKFFFYFPFFLFVKCIKPGESQLFPSFSDSNYSC